MRTLVQEAATSHSPESLAAILSAERGLVLLRSGSQGRYSFLAANPFLTLKTFGSRCEIAMAPDGVGATAESTQYGNPWHLLDSLMSRYEMLDEIDQPFPLGGCFGYWGYELKNFTEPKLARRAANDLGLPDSHVGFYDSLVVFDHLTDKTSVVSTGLKADGSRNEQRAAESLRFWQTKLAGETHPAARGETPTALDPGTVSSNVSKADFITAVEQAQRYIRSGDIYQVNLSQRLSVACEWSGWELFQRLSAVSPAPFSAYLDCGDFQIASSSPEQFLRMSGAHIVTRPIKGTRPRGKDTTQDVQFAHELQTSGKEMAELVMITDLLRNDLGRVCEYGSVQVPDLARLERFAQVQHLVSTIEGRLRQNVTHFAAFASCFPGGSITGAPKFRAMEIIDELEPVSRGPYCGAIGYLGFNRESQLNIAIRTAILQSGTAHFNVGAGIVADSNPEAEYEETMAKARGFLAALRLANTTAIPAE